jgi:iron complex transport system ATP-binding protein
MALETRALGVSIRGKEILHNVSICFPGNKRTAIIGPNGAGKSTLLRILAGLEHNYEGKVLLDGQELCGIGRKALSRRLAILPQGMTAPADITVERLVDYGRFPYRSWLHSSNGKADREAVECALRETGLRHFRDRQVAELSGGERQRAWIAMALAQQPEILLLDEPTTYLDIAHQLEVMQILTKLNRDYQMTVIMVLHDINHALQYADELVILKNHGIFAQGTPEKILTVDMVASVFGVKADIFLNSRGKAVLSPVSIVPGKKHEMIV